MGQHLLVVIGCPRAGRLSPVGGTHETRPTEIRFGWPSIRASTTRRSTRVRRRHRSRRLPSGRGSLRLSPRIGRRSFRARATEPLHHCDRCGRSSGMPRDCRTWRPEPAPSCARPSSQKTRRRRACRCMLPCRHGPDASCPCSSPAMLSRAKPWSPRHERPGRTCRVGRWCSACRRRRNRREATARTGLPRRRRIAHTARLRASDRSRRRAPVDPEAVSGAPFAGPQHRWGAQVWPNRSWRSGLPRTSKPWQPVPKRRRAASRIAPICTNLRRLPLQIAELSSRPRIILCPGRAEKGSP